MRWTIDQALVERALDALEQRELRLLVWGLVDPAMTAEEVRRVLLGVFEDKQNDTLFADPDCTIGNVDELFRHLREQVLLLEVPSCAGSEPHWRTRMAEGVRLLARLRQLFPKHATGDAWLNASTLVADYRLLWRQRRYPKRDITAQAALDELAQPIGSPSLEALRHWFGRESGSWRMARFQLDASLRILAGLEVGTARGTMIAAGTGSGKTLAFYLPALSWLAAQCRRRLQSTGVSILAIYPRNELLKDQLGEVYAQCRRFDDFLSRAGKRRLSVGVLFGDTPESPKYARMQWNAGRGEVVCPFLACPECQGELLWRSEDFDADRERLVCRACGHVVEGEDLRLSRQSLRHDPPDILFTTTEMLNRRLSDAQTRHLFGIGPRARQVPPLVLLDEVHLYAGAYGAQVAYLLRRWSTMTRRRSQFIGLSATLAEGKAFFAALTGLDESAVEEIAPRAEDMESEGAEYLIALRGDPVSRSALLSTSIQSLMLMSRLLDTRTLAAQRPFSGWRAFAFTDQMDATNRLYYDLMDAEGRTALGHPATRRAPNGGLAALRRRGAGTGRRYEGGQDWRACEEIGHDLSRRLTVGRTTSYDKGVAASAEVIVATAALEVGYDDPAVGVVLQHKAPRDLAQFLQRKGRAGRQRHMRPWTLMVLSDYGRDRVAYQSYEQFFDPDLPPRALPLGNRYIQRMQATYALLDYLGMHMQQGEPSGAIWRDLSGPQEFRFDKELKQRLEALVRDRSFPLELADWKDIQRQALALMPASISSQERWSGPNRLSARLRRIRLVRLLSEILDQPEATARLADHLGEALDLATEDLAPLLWKPPRALLLNVIPTTLRRLASDWRGPEGPQTDYAVGHPLPEFVPAALFSDLSLPELLLERPDGVSSDEETRYLPLVQGLNEFAPGKISRRFDVALWLGPGAAELQSLLEAGQPDVECDADIGLWFGLQSHPPMAMLEEDGRVGHRPAYRPVSAQLRVPPGNAAKVGGALPAGEPRVVDKSNARLQWRSQLFARGRPMELPVPEKTVGIAGLIEVIQAHTHAAQTPVVVRRYAVASQADLRIRHGLETVEQRIRWRFTHADHDCALGFEMEADALVFVLKLPATLHRAIAWDDACVLHAARSARFLRETVYGSRLAAYVPNVFLRQWLAQVFQTAIALECRKQDCDVSMAVKVLASGARTELLRLVLKVVFQSSTPDDTESRDESDDDVEDRTPDHLRADLEKLLAHQDVLGALAGCACVLYVPIDADWDDWLLDTVRHTLGAALLDAIQQSCPEVDTEDLAVDIEPGPRADGSRPPVPEIWISEIHPGGNGLIEQILDVLTQEPERFFRRVENALMPSEFELIDGQLRDVLEWIGTERDEKLAEQFAAVRMAQGIAEAETAFTCLRRSLLERGHAVFHGYLLALSSRLLRTGTPVGLDSVLADILAAWNQLEARLQIEVDARVIAAMFSNDDRIERAFAEARFEIPPVHEREGWRFNVIYSLLWARGHALRAHALPLENRFNDLPVQTERLLLGQWLTPRESPIDGTAADWQARLYERLAQTGQATMSLPTAARAQLRQVMATVIVEPIQLEYLNLYVRLAGVERRAGHVEIAFELPGVGR